ncbi:MAG TPA: hypothetical protein VNU95_00210 [Candidatus Acidoferrales bacterium]|jgi:hypothetical protein|nr:hypothetical protein [Candidatus Acidoferrales bacterium]
MNCLNNRRKHPSFTVHNRAWRRAFECLDGVLDQNTPSNNSEKIAAMRRAYFADVDALDEIVLPERKK